MKLPEYALKEDIEIKTDRDTMSFPAGTLIFPFWSESNLPSHRLKELREAMAFVKPIKSKLIFCIIGTQWIMVPEDKIRKV